MKKYFFILVCFIGLIGCANKPQAPVNLELSKTMDTTKQYGVVFAEIPKPDTNFPGADCLLCQGVAAMAHSALTAHVKALPVNDLSSLKSELTTVMTKKGFRVKEIAGEINVQNLPSSSKDGANFARKDFTSLKSKHGVDKLLVVQVQSLGISRNYSAYFPTAEPKAILLGAAYIVNLVDNSYEWYLPINTVRAAAGKWEEAPKFPNLTNAYFEVIELTKDSIKKPFLE